MVRVWMILVSFAVLAACRSTPDGGSEPDPGTLATLGTLGTEVHLLRDLPLASGQYDVYIQDGDTSALGAREFKPYCRWRLLRQTGEDRVPAGVYAVARSWRESGYFTGDNAMPTMLSDLSGGADLDGWGLDTGWRGRGLGDSPDYVTFGVVMDLLPSEDRGRAAYRLFCARLSDPRERDRFPTMQQIGNSVDGIIAFEHM